METRIALIGIIVEDPDSVQQINAVLHEKKVNIISVVVDAENNVISSLSGKLGMLPGISVKTVYSKAGAQ